METLQQLWVEVQLTFWAVVQAIIDGAPTTRETIYEGIVSAQGHGIGLFFALLPLSVGYVSARIALRRREFREVVAFQVHYLESRSGDDFRLSIGALPKCTIGDLTNGNVILGGAMRRAGARVNDECQIVTLRDAYQQREMLNAIQGWLSSLGGGRWFRRTAQGGTETTPWQFAITFAKFGAERVRKLRVLVIYEDDLVRFLDTDFLTEISDRQPQFADRILMLHHIAQKWIVENTVAEHCRNRVGEVHMPNGALEAI